MRGHEPRVDDKRLAVFGNVLVQLDVDSGQQLATVELPAAPIALAWGESCGPGCGDLWVAGERFHLAESKPKKEEQKESDAAKKEEEEK